MAIWIIASIAERAKMNGSAGGGRLFGVLCFFLLLRGLAHSDGQPFAVSGEQRALPQGKDLLLFTLSLLYLVEMK